MLKAFLYRVPSPINLPDPMETDRSRDLRHKLQATQEQNEVIFSMIERTKKMIQRARLERALLLEKLDHVSRNPALDDMDETTPPQSPPEPKQASLKTEDKRSGGNKLPNAYTVFCDEERDNVVRALEETGTPIKSGQIQSTLSDRWKALSKEQKKPYSEKARELKKRAESEETEDESKEVNQAKDVKEEVREDQDIESAREETEEPPTEPLSELASEPIEE